MMSQRRCPSRRRLLKPRDVRCHDLNGRIAADMCLAKAYTVWDALTRRRTNGAVVMVSWECPPGVEFDASRLKALGFVRELVPVLRHYMPA